jgi:polar amino acid transport system permease protein
MSSIAAEHVLTDKEQWRRSYRRARKRRSTVIAAISTVVVAALVAIGISHAPGWTDAHQSFLSGHEFRVESGDIFRGLLIDAKIFLISEPCVLVLALLIAVLRTSTAPVLAPARIGCALYVDIFRGCPTIILLFLVGLGVPSLQLHHVTNSVEVWGTVAIVISYSAYVTEVMRSGIQSVHPSQRAAGRSLGLSARQTMRLIVIPQAFRGVIPALLNDLVALTKDVGLISIIGAVPDAIERATAVEDQIFNFTPYVIAAIMFILIAAPLGRFSDWYTLRAYQRQRGGVVV